MSFSSHRTNAFEWFYYGSRDTGYENDAELLLLSSLESEEGFASYFRTRVKKVSTRAEEEKKYDHIVIPRLTERLLLPYRGELETLLSELSEKNLQPGGSILLGIENRDSLERIASGIYEKSWHYETEASLKALRGKLSLRYPRMREGMYYPLPSLEMPLNLYSMKWLPKRAENDALTDRLLETNRFTELCPAFVYQFQRERDQGQEGRDSLSLRPQYVKYNSSRKAEYAIKTAVVLDESGQRHVLKQALTVAANAHIESIPSHEKQLRESNTALSVLKEEKMERSYGNKSIRSSLLFPFIKGKSIGAILASYIEGGAAPREKIEESIDLILGSRERELCPANLDCLFENVLMQEERPTLIDCEWVKTAPVSRAFLRYRMLHYWYEEHKREMKYGDEAEFLRAFSISAEEKAGFEASEQRFQREVHGSGEESNLWAYQEQRVSLENFEKQKREIQEKGAVIENLKERLRISETELKKEREVQRLTGIHVGNLTQVIETHEKDLASLQKDLVYYHAHQSLHSRVFHRIRLMYDKKVPAGSRKRKVHHYIFRTIFHPVKMLPMLLSKEGRNRIGGDFVIGSDYAESGKLYFERAEKPLVSIIIPCYNQVEYTYRCLRSILRYTSQTETPYEVIIADDVSTDATRDLPLYAENLVIARNTENMGFLKNCNQAASIAKGEYLFFLNNDTTVSEGWLSSLVELMQKDPSIGMCGSKLVYPDGRLQEAGGIIWSDASGWNYGRLQDPTEPQYNYVKEVDYISGAAILIRHALWKEIGGFDELFAPAYCEDSDLAFEVRKHGKRVVYQPKSVVTHYEGISNGTDVAGTGLKRYQLVNQEKFKEKWKDALTLQYENNGNPNPFKARERGQGKKYILVVDHYVPTYDKDAGSKTSFQYLRLFLEQGYRVKFLGDNFLHEEPYSTTLEQMGIEILSGEKMQQGIWEWIDTNREMIDIAYLQRPHIATKYIDYIREHSSWRILFYGHDLHFLRETREYQLTGDPEILKEAEYWKSVELSVMKRCDSSYYPSQLEADAVHEIDGTIRVKGITAYIFWDRAEINENYAEREGLLFVGGFAHPPNKDGVLWFANKILPRIRERIPNLRFRIVGSHADEEILALQEREGIEVLGFVSEEELHALYQKSRMVVVPLRYGAGVKGKVVEALHEGAAIVTTSCGAEGIAGVEKTLWIANQEEGFAEQIIRNYENDHILAAQGRSSIRFVEENFSERAAWENIREDFVF